jgi:hypothetical protein
MLAYCLADPNLAYMMYHISLRCLYNTHHTWRIPDSHETISSRDLCLGGEAKARALVVENDILALEEDITEDGEANTRVALDTTVAGGATIGDGGVVDVFARNNGIVALNSHSEVREVGVAVESVTTNGAVVLGTGNLLVVGGDNRVVNQEKSGASICTIQRISHPGRKHEY